MGLLKDILNVLSNKSLNPNERRIALQDAKNKYLPNSDKLKEHYQTARIATRPNLKVPPSKQDEFLLASNLARLERLHRLKERVAESNTRNSYLIIAGVGSLAVFILARIPETVHAWEPYLLATFFLSSLLSIRSGLRYVSIRWAIELSNADEEMRDIAGDTFSVSMAKDAADLTSYSYKLQISQDIWAMLSVISGFGYVVFT